VDVRLDESRRHVAAPGIELAALGIHPRGALDRANRAVAHDDVDVAVVTVDTGVAKDEIGAHQPR
jgi:hypothetical protein